MMFPIFTDISGSKVIVVGGGKIGTRRAKVLLDFGADVTVISPTIAEEIKGITHIKRKFNSSDLQYATIVVAATNCRKTNFEVGKEARENNIPVSVADCAEECTFFFPAICKGKSLVAGVVSEGTEHHKTAKAAKEIRNVLESI